jgi:hypothetical protein
MKITETSEKELLINKNSISQLCFLVNQMKSCAGILLDAAENVYAKCEELQSQKKMSVTENEKEKIC